MSTPSRILSIKNLEVWYKVYGGHLKVVDGIDLDVAAGEKVGLVGETGSGKTTTMKAVMRLLPIQARIPGGEILFMGNDVLLMGRRKLAQYRSSGVSMIFQDPTASLNPVFRVGSQLGAAIRSSMKGSSSLSFGSSAKTAELHDRRSLIKGSSSLSFGSSAKTAELHDRGSLIKGSSSLSFGSSAKTAELHDRGSLIKGSSSLSFGRSATNADLHGECNSDKSIWSSGETAELHGGEGSLPSSSSVEGSGKLSRKERIYERSKAVLSNVALPDPDRILRNYPFQLSGGMRQRICIALAVSTARTMLIADEPTTSLDVTIQAQILDLIRKIVDEKRTSLVLITHSLGVAREMTDRVYVMYAGTMIEVARTERLYDNPLHPYTQGLLVSVPRLTGGGFANGIPGRIPDYLNPPAGCRFAPRCPKVFDACRERKPPFFEIAPDHKVACFLYDKRGSAHA